MCKTLVYDFTQVFHVLGGKFTSTEILAQELYNQLNTALAGHHAALHKVRLVETENNCADLLGLLMAPVEGAGEQQSSIGEEKKRRKRKRRAQARGVRR